MLFRNKVLQIGPSGQGGVNTVIESIIDSKLNTEYEFQRINTIEGKRKLIPYLNSWKTIISCISDINIVHIHVASKGSFLRKSFIIDYFNYKKVPVILHLHGGKFREFYYESSRMQKLRIKSVFNKASKIIVLTKDWLQFTETLGVLDKTVIVPNFTSIPEVDIAPKRIDDFTILFLGRLGKLKGTYDLIKATGILINEKKIRNLKLILAGDGDCEEIREYASNLGISDYINITGWVDSEKKHLLLSLCDIVVLPSYFESFGLSLIEGMSHGKPVIGTTAGSIPNVVINGEDGLLIEAGDVIALSESIMELYENTQLREYMGTKARENAIKKYSEDSVCRKIENVYKECIKLGC